MWISMTLLLTVFETHQTISYLINCEQSRHPYCRQIFLIEILLTNFMQPFTRNTESTMNRMEQRPLQSIQELEQKTCAPLESLKIWKPDKDRSNQ